MRFPIAVFFGQGFKNQTRTTKMHMPRAGRSSAIDIKWPLKPCKRPNISSLSQLRKSVSKKY